jgi:hypothetical protein
MQRRRCWVRPAWGASACLTFAGCTHAGFGTTEKHFATFSVPVPNGSTVHVCHAYGCSMRTKFTFTPLDISDLGALMRKTRLADTPHEERRAVAYAIGWMEVRVGNVIGTKDDRPGMDFAASGDPTQQDCVDEATNTTSYLTVLQNNGLLKHHLVSTPFAKENFLRGVAGWTHWAAVLVEKPSAGDPRSGKTPSPGGQRWAVDSWIEANGENPAIVEAEKWYIDDLSSLPRSMQ